MLRWSVASLLLLILLCSCGKPKTLIGDWRNDTDPYVLSLTSDGSFGITSSQDGASVSIVGTYSSTADTLTLSSPISVGQPERVVFHYKWLADDKIELQADGRPNAQLTRIGPGHIATANGTSGGANVPVFPPTPEQVGRRQATTCLANVKQLSMGVAMYAVDYDDALPSTNWSVSLQPYVKTMGIYTCPTLAEAKKEGGYAYDSRMANARLKDVKEPGRTITFFESTMESIGVSDPGTSTLKVPRHGDRINFAFADGHAKGLIPGEKP